MDLKSKTLFDVVGEGDDITLQRLLLEGKEERNVATLAHGNTLLHEACWKGFSRCVKILCNVYPKDLDENSSKEKLFKKKQQFINRPNFCGFTALHLAAQNGHNQCTRELLYAGCSTSIQNDYGDSALHTGIRYGHAGVVRILISAKCDIDAFNLNHDTPLHISSAIGRRKLTKLLVEAGAMQFRNKQNETPHDIARRKNLVEILEIMDSQADKIDKKLIRDSLRKSKSSTTNNHTQQCLPHKHKHNDSKDIMSPYGCHYYPDTRKFPSPKLQTLPKEPLQKGEVYYLDLAGNIRKGPVGMCRCNCAPYSKEAMVEHCKNIQKYVDKANEKLNKKITELTSKIEKTERKHHQREKSKERDLDPLYPLLKIVGDKNKQIHLEKWLKKVYPEAGSYSDMQSRQSSEIMKEVPVDVHRDNETPPSHKNNNNTTRESIKVTRNNSRKMPQFDEHRDDKNKLSEEMDIENDDSYTDISDDFEENDDDDEEDDRSISNSENPLYDESFMRKFQQQQFVQNSYPNPNDSITSASVNSNQNIEMEMEKITKSLLHTTTDVDGGVMISSRNPDVIKDHIHVSHSAKRSTKKIKSAITKPTSVLSSGDLYVNSYFNNEKNSHSDPDEVDSCEIDHIVTKVQQTMLSSNYASSAMELSHFDMNGNDNHTLWNQVGKSRSRNPLPMTDEIENYADNLFKNAPEEQFNQVPSFSENNFVLLDKLLKVRKQLNHNYQQQLQMITNDDNQNNKSTDFNIPSSSLV